MMNLPKNNSIWKHNKTNQIYRLIVIANTNADESRKEEYPLTAVYRSDQGQVWSRKLDRFLDSFTEIN